MPRVIILHPTVLPQHVHRGNPRPETISEIVAPQHFYLLSIFFILRNKRNLSQSPRFQNRFSRIARGSSPWGWSPSRLFTKFSEGVVCPFFFSGSLRASVELACATSWTGQPLWLPHPADTLAVIPRIHWRRRGIPWKQLSSLQFTNSLNFPAA